MKGVRPRFSGFRKGVVSHFTPRKISVMILSVCVNERRNGHQRLVGGDASALRGVSVRLLHSRQVHISTDIAPHKGRHYLLTACLDIWV